MISVLVCDDEHLIRAALVRMIDAAPDLTVVAEAADGGEAVRAAAVHRPDVVLMDIRMPVLDGIEATRRILCEPGAGRVLVLTTYHLDEYVYDALLAGASGFLLKDSPIARLQDAIRTVASGNAVLAPETTARLIEQLRPKLPTAEDRALLSALRRLSTREREVAELVAAGLSNDEIAGRLAISRYTVKIHVSKVLAKLGLPDRVHIALAWSRLPR